MVALALRLTGSLSTRRWHFLSKISAYPKLDDTVAVRETHMSWVFLTGDRVYKLKKPLRSRFLNFSTCKRREMACRAEVLLNRRLARQTYIGAVPLTVSENKLAIDGNGTVVDWLVVMHRLDERLMLEEKILDRRLDARDLDCLAAVLANFYRNATPSSLSPDQEMSQWKRGLALNRQVLLTANLNLPAGLIRRIDRTQQDFLTTHENLFVKRSRARLIVDAHGDLRPEHIWLGQPLQIIDCLEFNAHLRRLDVLSEIAFLDLECERLGAGWAGGRIRKQIFKRLPKLGDEVLFHFYRSYHAMVRARLAIAHLLELHPRKPAKWRPLALRYLQFACEDVRKFQKTSKNKKIC